MQNNSLTVTMTRIYDRHNPRFVWCGHGGHGGHGTFHLHTRAHRHTPSSNHISIFLSCVCNITMTTMTSMTRLVIARVVAVIEGGHGYFNYDTSFFSSDEVKSGALQCK